MKILVVSATRFEAAPLKDALSPSGMIEYVEFLETGPGMVATTYVLTKHLQSNSFDFVLNIGVAGAIGNQLTLGNVVAVEKDCFFELGAEAGLDFIPIDLLGLNSTQKVNAVGYDDSSLDPRIRRVEGITVNTVHGTILSEQLIRNRSEALVETMEGAAFYFVCGQEKVRCLQLRSISNRVELRDREKWDLKLAIDQLTKIAFELIQKLLHENNEKR